MNEQSANAVAIIRPDRFHPNPETALDNPLQGVIADPREPVARVSNPAVEALSEAGVAAHGRAHSRKAGAGFA